MDGGGKEFGEKIDVSLVVYGEVEIRGYVISILFGFWISFICDIYIVFFWNNRKKMWFWC